MSGVASNGSPYGVFGGCTGPSCGAPVAFLSATPSTVVQGQSSILTWSSTNATSCTGTGFTAGSASGNQSTGPLNTPGNFSYQVVCTNASGVNSRPALATITVLPPSNLVITANPSRITSGGTVEIAWSGFGVDSCIVSGPSGTLANGNADAGRNFSTNSPQSVIITAQSVFTITCQASGSTVTRSVVVNLLPTFKEF